MSVVSDQRRLAHELVQNLEALRGDRAVMARLKRCAGRTLADCPEAFPAFYRLLPSEARGKDRLEDHCFLISTLFPLAPEPSTNDLGSSLRQLASTTPQHAEGIDRRLAVLLDCSLDALPFRLRQTVALLAAAGVGIDWRQSMIDVLEWEWTGHPTQKRWARSYFGSPNPNSE